MATINNNSDLIEKLKNPVEADAYFTECFKFCCQEIDQDGCNPVDYTNLSLL